MSQPLAEHSPSHPSAINPAVIDKDSGDSASNNTNKADALAKGGIASHSKSIGSNPIAQSQWYRLSPSDDQVGFVALPKSDLALSNRGFAYGDGFFTTMRVTRGSIDWQAQHLARILNHATALSFAIDTQTVSHLALQLLKQAQALKDGMLKLIITRAAQIVRGYGFSDSEMGQACEYWLQVIPTTPATLTNQSAMLTLPDGTKVTLHEPIKAICLDSKIACLPPTLAGLKTLNRLDSVLASAELQRARSAALINPPIEGLVKDMGGDWVEGTMSNVFYRLKDSRHQHKGHWYTPPLNRSGVKGVMRTVIIEGFASFEKPIIERYLTDQDLPHITQMFFCNAVRGVMPVAQLALDGQMLLGLLPIDSASLNSVIT